MTKVAHMDPVAQLKQLKHLTPRFHSHNETNKRFNVCNAQKALVQMHLMAITARLPEIKSIKTSHHGSS